MEKASRKDMKGLSDLLKNFNVVVKKDGETYHELDNRCIRFRLRTNSVELDILECEDLQTRKYLAALKGDAVCIGIEIINNSGNFLFHALPLRVFYMQETMLVGPGNSPLFYTVFFGNKPLVIRNAH